MTKREIDRIVFLLGQIKQLERILEMKTDSVTIHANVYRLEVCCEVEFDTIVMVIQTVIENAKKELLQLGYSEE